MRDKQILDQVCLQDVAINLLATGYSLKEVAEVLGVTVRKIYEWQRSDPSFRSTVMSLREQEWSKQR